MPIPLQSLSGTWRVLILLGLIWVLAGGVLFWMRTVQPTPATLEAYLEKHPLENLPASEREKVITAAAHHINRLSFEQRQTLRRSGTDRRFFKQMTEEERKRFLDLTLPVGFRQLMGALNKMNPEQRKKMVQRALRSLEREEPEINDRINREAVQQMIAQGMDSFYQDADSEVKLDFAPVIEELQRSTQGLR